MSSGGAVIGLLMRERPALLIDCGVAFGLINKKSVKSPLQKNLLTDLLLMFLHGIFSAAGENNAVFR